MNIKCKLGIHKYKCIESIILRKKDNRDLVDTVEASFQCKRCGYIKKEIQRFSEPTTIEK